MLGRGKALTSVGVLVPVAIWKEIDGLPWVRLASIRERRAFIESLRPYTRGGATPDELFRTLSEDGRRRYLLVILLADAPKCILKRAAEKFRVRDICG